MMANRHCSVDSAHLFSPAHSGAPPVRPAILHDGAPRVAAFRTNSPIASR